MKIIESTANNTLATKMHFIGEENKIQYINDLTDHRNTGNYFFF